MSEEKQDLEDYIQYNFDGIPSFKLALFLNSGKIEVKFAFGKVEENLSEELVELAEQINKSPEKEVFHLGNREFLRKPVGKDKVLVGTSAESRFFALTAGNNTFMVFCCGKTSEKDEPYIRELVHELLC